jgi:5'-nucleotidase
VEVEYIELAVIAPDANQSATARSITTRRPLWVEEVPFGDGTVGYATDGTPVDCVRLAALGLIDGFTADLIVSGINHGSNLGDDITYSGTVAGALEGALLGPPGIAVSVKRTPTYDFAPSAAAAAKVAAAVLKHGLPARSFININVPAGTPKGMRVTTQAKRNHVTKIDARTDPRGGAYYWIEEALDEYHPDSGRTDHEAVKEGYVSVTPLQPDMTAYEVLERLVKHLK